MKTVLAAAIHSHETASFESSIEQALRAKHPSGGKHKNIGTVIGVLIGIALSSQPDALTVHKETWMLSGFQALPYLPENI